MTEPRTSREIIKALRDMGKGAIMTPDDFVWFEQMKTRLTWTSAPSAAWANIKRLCDLLDAAQINKINQRLENENARLVTEIQDAKNTIDGEALFEHLVDDEEVKPE